MERHRGATYSSQKAPIDLKLQQISERTNSPQQESKIKMTGGGTIPRAADELTTQLSRRLIMSDSKELQIQEDGLAKLSLLVILAATSLEGWVDSLSDWLHLSSSIVKSRFSHPAIQSDSQVKSDIPYLGAKITGFYNLRSSIFEGFKDLAYLGTNIQDFHNQ